MFNQDLYMFCVVYLWYIMFFIERSLSKIGNGNIWFTQLIVS